MADLAETLSAALRTRYMVRRELGRGGMATVFLARDVRASFRRALVGHLIRRRATP